MKFLSENIFEQFGPNVLTSEEMKQVHGGVDSRPKSRDKDVFDDDTQ